MRPELSVIFSESIQSSLSEQPVALQAFNIISLNDWMRAMKSIPDATSECFPELAAAEYVACFVAPSEAHDDVMFHTNRIGIPVFQINGTGQDDPLVVMTRLCGTLLHLLDAARRHAAQEMMSNARLRREYEDLQSSFFRLEYFVYSLGGPQLQLGEQHNPATETVHIKQHHGVFLTQALTTSIKGLVAVEVYIHGVTAANSCGVLELALTDKMGTTQASTSLRISNLTLGWNKFMFGKSVDCSDREGMMTLRLTDTAPDSFVTLGLGRPTAVPELRLVAPEGTPPDAPLAFKSWRGIPGTRVPATDPSSCGSTVEFSRPSTLPFPCVLHCSDTKISFTPVQFRAKENAVLVHPPARGITIGAIENVSVTDLRRIRAVIHNGHKEAPLISFGLKALPNGASLADRIDIQSGAASSFRWTTLPPDCWGEINFECDTPISGNIDIILAALVADGSSNHMAWALFRGFELHLGSR